MPAGEKFWGNFPSITCACRATLACKVLPEPLLGAKVETPGAFCIRVADQLRVLAVQAAEPGPVSAVLAATNQALWDLAARREALLLVLATSVANSGTGLIVRSINSADGWQMIFWRSCFLALALCIVYVVQNGWRVRAAIRELRPWSLLGSVAVAAVNTCFILSLTCTTVANTMFPMSGAPLFAALLGWMVLRETVARGLWIAMGVASVGMGVMLWDGLGAGTPLGNALAVTASFCFGTFVVILRKGRGVNMLPVVILGTALGGASAGFLTGGTLSISWHDVGLLFLWDALISGTVHATFTWASRYVPGAELTLLVLIEFILSPMWVWLVIDERPSVATLIGGALVLASVASRAIASSWAESRRGP